MRQPVNEGMKPRKMRALRANIEFGKRFSEALVLVVWLEGPCLGTVFVRAALGTSFRGPWAMACENKAP